MRSFFRSALLIVAVLLLGFAPFDAHAETAPTALVKDFYTTLVETMKEGPKLGFDGRYKKLEPAVTKTFNLGGMARLAVGPAWLKASPEQREAMAKAFSDFSVATYASRFKKFDNETFTVTGEKQMPDGSTIVETKLTPDGEAPVILNYMVRKDETGAPRIMDVYLDASISELATRRADFSAVIKRDGMDALIASLKDKVKKMQTAQTGQ